MVSLEEFTWGETRIPGCSPPIPSTAAGSAVHCASQTDPPSPGTDKGMRVQGRAPRPEHSSRLGQPYLHVVRGVSLACGCTNKDHQGLINQIRLNRKTHG